MILLIMLNLVCAGIGILIDKKCFPVKDFVGGALLGIVGFWVLFIGSAVVAGMIDSLRNRNKVRAGK